MNKKLIQKPDINEKIQYGNILSWEFRDTITPIGKKYAFRFSLTFSNGIVYSMQRGGYRTKTEALKAKEFAIAELHSKKFIPFEYSLKEFYDFWLYYYMIDENDIAYNTFCTYRNVIYNYILKIWNPDKKINNIGREDVITVLNSIDKKAVLSTAYSVLRSSFAYAKSHQITRSNPALTAIRMKKRAVKKAFNQAIREGRMTYAPKQYPILSLSQISQLLLTCKNSYSEMYIPLLLSLTTGLRISESIAIKFSDIDLWEGELHVKRQLGRTLSNDGAEMERLCTQEIRTKTRSGERHIPLADFVIDELIIARHRYETCKKENPEFQDMDFICFKENGIPYNRSSFNRSFKQILKECGLPDMRWHDLRHTYATVLKENDISLKAISVCMGHHGTEITKKVYINTPKESVFACEEAIDAFITDILPQTTPILDVRISEKDMLEFFTPNVYNTISWCAV